ncbi:MAG: dihydroorotase [Deltaproteobacteria bacterium]|nr:dihydroorotase [Deltaproteobacteria bacterium]
MSKKIVLIGGRVCDPGSGVDGDFDVLIEDGKVAAVEKPGAFAGLQDVDVENVAGLLVVPGLMDVHVHLREPGFEWKETVATGSAAAAAGGFTTVCCMPNTKPVNDSGQTTRYILERAREAGLADVLPIGAITKGSEGVELAPMIELFEAGCVAFSDDGLPVMDANVMRRALEYSSMLGTVLSVHEEDLNLSRGFAMNEGVTSLKLGLKGFPEAAENVMIARDIELARLTGARVHFCHVSTARGALLVKRAKEDGIKVTAEVTPHHLTLTETACEDFNTLAKVSPPLRLDEDVHALREALESGVLDCIASDHAPHDPDTKNCAFSEASNGLLGLQTNVPLLFRLVQRGDISLRRMIESATTAPARCFGIEPNRIRKGSRANIAVLDPNRKILLTKEYLCSKSKNTPFLDQEFQGIAVKTFVGGRKVYDLGVTSA